MTQDWVLMDFDGTITTRDTTRYLLVELLKRRPWRAHALIGLVAARFSGDASKLQYQKNRCIGTLLAGMGEGELQLVVDAFHARVRPLFRASVVGELNGAIRNGCGVLIVTASPEFAVEGLFRAIGAACIGTRYETTSGRYTGELEGTPCYGDAKVPAVWGALPRGAERPQVIAAWSDSLSDMPMMLLAERRYWVSSDPKVLEVVRGDERAVVWK